MRRDQGFSFRDDATAEERAWCRRLNALIAAMPRRFVLLESAGSLTVLDREHMREDGMPDIEDGKSEPYRLACIPAATCRVTSVSG